MRDLPDVDAAPLAELGHGEECGPGLWRYAAALPVAREWGAKLSLGEGATPLIPAGEDFPGVSLKLEFLSPTLSFKDRGAVVMIAAAAASGTSAVIIDSSGNAGSAVAAYAARAGITCRVFLPAHASAGKRAQIEAYGARVARVDGDRTATMEAAIIAVRETGAYYASHVYDPYFIQGTKTCAFELWEQLGRAPSAVIVPVGNGTLLLGIARGFRELHAAGLVDRVPVLIAAQSERCAPLAEAFRTGAEVEAELAAGETVAEGIAIARPPRGAEILAAVRASGGCFVTVAEQAINDAQRELARRGLFVEPTAAVAWAALKTARKLTAGDVVVPLCGAGLKTL